jgi:hypothetical protein
MQAIVGNYHRRRNDFRLEEAQKILPTIMRSYNSELSLEEQISDIYFYVKMKMFTRE